MASKTATTDESGPADTSKSVKTVRTDDQSKGRTDQNEHYTCNIKPQFVLKERSPSLAPLPETEQTGGDDRDRGNNKKKKYKGMNKKRPRNPKVNDTEKLCLAILAGDKCPFGDKCRFSHDVKAYLANREPDITQVDGGCPKYNAKGFCEHGAMCRLGSSHVNMSTGENLRDATTEPPPPVMNGLSRETQQQLRKNKYPFKCKRHFEVDKSKKTKKNGDDTVVAEKTTNETTDEKPVSSQPQADVDFSPLPTKRKLIDFRNKVYVAPLTTVGNLPFRRVMKRFGADITCGEMAIGSQLLEGKASEWALLKRHPEEDVFGVQIASGYPDQFTRVCELLEAHTTVDFVDLNLGCPLDLICNKGAGSALMLREKRLKLSLEGITSTLSCPITIKMRTGWDEGKPVAHQLVSKIQKWGIDGIGAAMVHGRSRLQRYSKLANWDYISTIAAAQSADLPQIPIIGNGDIFSYTDYEDKIALEGISPTAMLARGALIKPWLPTEIKERRHWDISASERLDLLKDFARFGLEHWGSDNYGVNNTRRFLLEWLSFLHRYIPVGMLEVVPQQMNQRSPPHLCGRSDLETLMLSKYSSDWIKISEMLLGPVQEGFEFEPKHRASG